MFSTGARPVLFETTRAEILLAFLFSMSATVLQELTCLLQATQWFTLFWSVGGTFDVEEKACEVVLGPSLEERKGLLCEKGVCGEGVGGGGGGLKALFSRGGGAGRCS